MRYLYFERLVYAIGKRPGGEKFIIEFFDELAIKDPSVGYRHNQLIDILLKLKERDITVWNYYSPTGRKVLYNTGIDTAFMKYLAERYADEHRVPLPF